MSILDHTETLTTYNEAGDELGTMTLELSIAYSPAFQAAGYGRYHNPGTDADFGIYDARIVGTGVHYYGCSGPEAVNVANRWLKQACNRQIIADRIAALAVAVAA